MTIYEKTHENLFYLPWQQSVTERISRHWRAKRGKSGHLDEKPTTVLLPLGEVKKKDVRVSELLLLFYYCEDLERLCINVSSGMNVQTSMHL